jgi:hypothetical protein
LSYAKLLKFGEVSDLDKGQREYLRNLLLENDTMDGESDIDELDEGGPVIDDTEFEITEGSEFKEKMDAQIVNFEGDAIRRDEDFLRECREKENGVGRDAPSLSNQP